MFLIQSEHRRHLSKDSHKSSVWHSELLQEDVEEVFQDIDIDREVLFRSTEQKQHK